MRLVEAGSLITSNAKTENFLRDGDRCDQQTRFTREVHYGSAACLFVRPSAFRAAGGFDAQLYELPSHPMVQAVHHEHSTFGANGASSHIASAQSTFASVWSKELSAEYPVVSAPAGAQGALSAHILARDVRSSGKTGALRVLLYLTDGPILAQLKAAIVHLLLLSSESDKEKQRDILITIVVDEEADKSGSSSSSTDLKQRADAWAAVEELRMVGVEVLVDETERSTGVPYSGGEGAAHAQPYLKQGRLQSSADGCAYKYWQRRAPALEHVLVERPEYYDVVVLGGGASPAAETTLRSAGVKALITVSIEDGVKLKAEETWSAGGRDGAEFSKTLVASAEAVSPEVVAPVVKSRLAQIQKAALSQAAISVIRPPSYGPGVVTLSAAWSPVLWAAVAGTVRAWAAVYRVPFICSPELYKCSILDSATPGEAVSMEGWARHSGSIESREKSRLEAAASGWWGIHLSELPGDSIRNHVLDQNDVGGGRKTLLLLMPPQQECTLKLRNWYEEHKHPAPSNKITGKSGKPELSVRDLLYDMDVAKRLCQERSVCSTIVGRLCVSEEDAQMAVTAIQQRLAPESVLLMPLSAFESALRALLQRLAAFFERPKSWEKPLAMAEERALPSEAEFGLWAATQSSVAVAEALVDIDRTYASTIAVGDVDTDADSQDIHNAQ
eukprot:gene918-1029_t